LVDECHLFLAPVLVGGGKRSLPEDVRLKLELLDERRFGNGTVYLRYRTFPAASSATASPESYDVDRSPFVIVASHARGHKP
ncbi:MAG: hypothetical protein ABR592_06205, partial [Nitriliruptorales bacterium]